MIFSIAFYLFPFVFLINILFCFKTRQKKRFKWKSHDLLTMVSFFFLSFFRMEDSTFIVSYVANVLNQVSWHILSDSAFVMNGTFNGFYSTVS